MGVWICSNQYQSVLYSAASQAKRSQCPLSRHPHLPTLLPGRSWWLSAAVSGCGCHTELRDTAGEGSPRVQCGLARAGAWFPPGLIQDLLERRTRVSTVPIKNKLCNRWIPISCSSGTAQSHPSLAVAQERLSHSWKSSLTDTSQQDRPMCLRGERFGYRPAPGSVQTEKGWQRSLVYFSLLPSVKDGIVLESFS